MSLHIGCSAQHASIITKASPQKALRCNLQRASASQSPLLARRSRLPGSKSRSKPGSLQVVSGLVRQVQADELEVLLAERQVPIIVDFYATWCGPCVLLAKELETVAEELGPDKVQILKIDTDQNPEISSQLQIQGLPTMVFVGMDKTKPALRTEGLLPAKTIKEIVENELSAAPAPAA